ncbi:MAG: NADPH:quinone reductase [Microbacterium sp.]|uniref:NADPH:quinone reductase n=1 Tax=Microbacterium sp. TaxID=51671 RepID=UPI003F81FDC4
MLQYGDLPTPAPGQGEVLVRISASGVNPSDVKARAGTRGGRSRPAFDVVVPHSDGAGTIVDRGPGAERFSVGDRVWLCNGQWRRPMGTAAEYISIDENLVFALPGSVSDRVGAALGIPALTACHAATGYGDLSGRVVLVSGGAGTVGRLAVQFAKHAGAWVIASGRTPSSEEAILSAGADAFVSYESPSFVDDVRQATGDRPVDHAIEVEFGANVDRLTGLLADRATVVAFGSARMQTPPLPFYELLFKGVRLEFLLVYLLTDEERHAAATRVNQLLVAGDLDVRVDSEFALTDCASAHELVERGGHRGAVVLRVN